MIRYALRCKQGHDFDSWFRSADDFERLRDSGQVACSQCGVVQVEKALMAPSVPTKAPTVPDKVAAVAKLRSLVEKHSTYVGPRFATEARAIHEGRAPERAIHGEANLKDAEKLLEDGIDVAPLPFTPRQKMN